MRLGRILAAATALAMVVVSGMVVIVVTELENKVKDAAKDYIVDKVAEKLGLAKGVLKLVSENRKQDATDAVPLIVDAVHDPERGCPEVTSAVIAAQIYHESGYDPTIVSPADARGMAQFVPGTWSAYGVDGNRDGRKDVNDPRDAIPSMVAYDCSVARSTRKVPGDPVRNMLAGYNAGPDAVVRWGGVPGYRETTNYVRKITATVGELAAWIAAESAAEDHGSSFGAEVVAQAEKWTGRKLPYLWAGGDKDGPTPRCPATHGASDPRPSGCPYVRPGEIGPPLPGRGGFDCSGLVLYAVYQARKRFGVRPNAVLAHQTESQLNDKTGRQVPMDQLKPGDVVFVWTNGPGASDPGHVVIYAGTENGRKMIIEAPRTGRDIRKVPLSSYGGRMEARRYG